MVVELSAQRELEAARQLLSDYGLQFEPEYDNLIGIYESGELIATAARAGRVLKMFAIRQDHSGGDVLGTLVTALINRGYASGIADFFVFTKPENILSFQSLNFTLLVCHKSVALLEYGHPMQRYLRRHAGFQREGVNGAVVVNCNPFTLGHRYLIETAASQVDNLYVFVVREDRSVFPFVERIRLVKEGCADLANVFVLDSSYYAVSAVTFPAYFLKAGTDVSELQMEIDLHLFAKHVAPFFGISRRFIGSEPYCTTTCGYNEAMKRVLPEYGMTVTQLDRREVGGEFVSASKVRAALKDDKTELVREWVPDTTYAFLASESGAEIVDTLKRQSGRHS